MSNTLRSKVAAEVAALEAEIAELEKAQQSESEDTETDVTDEAPETETAKSNTQDAEDTEEAKPNSMKELSFERRYGDLRKHTQEKEADYKARIAELEKKLAEVQGADSTEKKADILDRYREEAPDVVNLAETVAKQSQKELEEKLEAIERANKQRDEAEARASLIARHPDLPQIDGSEEFATWVKSFPSSVQQGIINEMVSGEDIDAADQILQKFKADTGYGKKRGRPSNDAAKSVKTGSTSSKDAVNQTGEKVYRESDLAKLDARGELTEEILLEYEQASREGKLIRDA